MFPRFHGFNFLSKGQHGKNFKGMGGIISEYYIWIVQILQNEKNISDKRWKVKFKKSNIS